MRTLISLLALTFCLTAVPVGAEDYPQPQGEKTGWLSINQAEDLVVIWRKQKRVMTGIECRPDLIGVTDLTERTQFRFTSVASGRQTHMAGISRRRSGADRQETESHRLSPCRGNAIRPAAIRPAADRALWHK